MTAAHASHRPFGPERIRHVRGKLSRAAFARAIGVTAQTVYRWELPLDADESRRPRGIQLQRLEQYAREPLRESSAKRTPIAFASAAPQPASGANWVDEDVSRVLPALERIFRADLRRGQSELVQTVASSSSLSGNARGAAYFGIALCELLDHADARSALLTISPLLGEAEAGRLSPDVSAKLFAVAALAHSFPDALLFDLGRVHAYKTRVDSGSGRTDDEAACIACLAALCGAALVSDIELLERAFSQLEETRWNALPPLLELHVEEFRILRSIYAGKSAKSVDSCEAEVKRAEEYGYPLLLARSLGRLALCELDVLTDPEQVLSHARRAKSLSHGARVAPGVHHLLALRAEIEALVRLGRIDEALVAADEVDAWTRDTGIPALHAVPAQTRLFHLTGRAEALHALATRLRSCELPSLRVTCRAYASHAEAVAALIGNEDPAVTIALFEQAEREAARWPFLLREVLLYRAYAHAGAGDAALGKVAVRKLQRFVDGFPSPWFTAQLRRLEGGLLAARGHWNEGRQMLESATATFELAKDRTDAALTRYLYCLIAAQVEAGDPQQLAQAKAELAQLGIVEPRSMQLGVARFGEQNRLQQGRHGRTASASFDVERLVVPLQRVAMRGAAPNLILTELCAVASQLFPGREVNLEEIDSTGSARPLFGVGARETGESEWIEFSDGAGRLLRIGVRGTLEREQRSALALLVTAASLALEVAVLRSVGEHANKTASEQFLPELPGFVAASVEMRKLRAELGRLAGSRSTVIISGESGAGKEIVARAIHDLSDRSARAYIAFNCATVPRDLFEGQLFGYRRGAFTGATADHPGVIRAANHGTLFLDEIGELPLDIQPKLLRFLENSEVFPLGERAPVRVDVRVLAATHRDLASLMREGRFREDLFYRLQVVPISVPPLRERPADIPVLARHFLRELTRHGEPPVLAPDALAALLAQPFPGNVRELKNVIERALAFFPDQPVLRAEHLKLLGARA